MDLEIGDKVGWIDNGTLKHFSGYIACLVPKGEHIPEWYVKGQRNPKGIRFRVHQLVARRDDRWLVDCGMDKVGKDTDGNVVDDVVYRMVPTWNRTLTRIS